MKVGVPVREKDFEREQNEGLKNHEEKRVLMDHVLKKKSQPTNYFKGRRLEQKTRGGGKTD